MPKKELPEVEHIELSDKHTRRRLIASIVFALIAVAMVGYFISSLLTTEPGWQTISSSALNSEEFVLQYNFGSDATAMNRRLTKLYTELLESSVKLFSADTSFENVRNLRYLSLNPNVGIELDPSLFGALEKFKDRRELFLAPIYDEYSSLFFCSYDYEAVNFDPLKNDDQRRFFDEVLSFALDPEKISLEFGDNNRVTLRVSEDYLAFAKEYGIVKLIDLSWMRNAFILDRVADGLISEGFTDGILTSYDGFMRALGGGEFTYPVYDRTGMTVRSAANALLQAPSSVVCFRDFMLNSLDVQHFYEYDDGTIRTPYIGYDGLSKSAVSSLILFSDSRSCSELLLEGLPAYVADEFDESLLESGRIWCRDYVIHCSGRVELGQIYSKDVQYTIKADPD